MSTSWKRNMFHYSSGHRKVRSIALRSLFIVARFNSLKLPTSNPSKMNEGTESIGNSNGNEDDSHSVLLPPKNVRGMTKLNRDLFQKDVLVPVVRVPVKNIKSFLPLVKQIILKMPKMPAVCPCDTDDTFRVVLLNPMVVKNWQSLPLAVSGLKELQESNFSYQYVSINYRNWSLTQIMQSVLPSDEEGLTSFSQIGHIVHVNLRPHLHPYKFFIGAVILDKVANCRTVVNKIKNISNVYRVSTLELLAGEAEYVVEIKEHGNTYKFDFSKVYWNPRLSTEHQRVANMLKAKDVFFDVFAGVGPFSVPATRKGCTVYANDLNPDSYKWLMHNIQRVKGNKLVKCYNLDGHSFIKTTIKFALLTLWRDNTAFEHNIYVCMNLPATSFLFLETFRGLFFKDEVEKLDFQSPDFKFPIVICYTFAKGEDEVSIDLMRSAIESALGLPLDDEILICITFVRNVAPNKNMFRIMLRLNAIILTSTEHVGSLDFIEPPTEAGLLEEGETRPNKRSADNDEPSKTKNPRI